MMLNKLIFICFGLVLFILTFNFGYNAGKEDVICDDCSYWKTKVYDIVYIGSSYQRLYNSCVEGNVYPQSDSLKRQINDLVEKYNLNEGVKRQ